MLRVERDGLLGGTAERVRAVSALCLLLVRPLVHCSRDTHETMHNHQYTYTWRNKGEAYQWFKPGTGKRR